MKVNRKSRTIVLSASESRAWEDGSEKGYAFRRSVRDAAASLARVSGRSVYIMAAKSAGGWTADVVTADAATDARDDSDD